MGVGPVELVILGVILLMLFGPALFAFWLGYTMGKKHKPAEEPGEPFASEAQPASPFSPAPPIESPAENDSAKGGDGAE